MPGNVKFEIRGAKEMQRLLKELGPKVATRVGRQAVRAGMKEVADEAKRLVPRDTGDLARSITVRTMGAARIDRGGGEDRRILAQLAFKLPDGFKAHFIEFGTVNMTARPFVRPAMDAKAGAALDSMGRVLARGIDREAAKLAKK